MTQLSIPLFESNLAFYTHTKKTVAAKQKPKTPARIAHHLILDDM